MGKRAVWREARNVECINAAADIARNVDSLIDVDSDSSSIMRYWKKWQELHTAVIITLAVHLDLWLNIVNIKHELFDIELDSMKKSSMENKRNSSKYQTTSALYAFKYLLQTKWSSKNWWIWHRTNLLCAFLASIKRTLAKSSESS